MRHILPALESVLNTQLLTWTHLGFMNYLISQSCENFTFLDNHLLISFQPNQTFSSPLTPSYLSLQNITPDSLKAHLIREMLFREDNPVSSLTLLLGIPENVTGNLTTEQFPELFTNRSESSKRVEIVMMPKDSRETVRNGIKVEFSGGNIEASVPVPFEMGVQAENGEQGKVSNLWKGKYVPKFQGSVLMHLSLTLNQTQKSLNVSFSNLTIQNATNITSLEQQLSEFTVSYPFNFDKEYLTCFGYSSDVLVNLTNTSLSVGLNKSMKETTKTDCPNYPKRAVILQYSRAFASVGGIQQKQEQQKVEQACEEDHRILFPEKKREDNMRSRHIDL